MDWTDIRLLLSIGGALVIAFILSTAETIWGRFFSVACGLFFAVFFTEPIIDWAGVTFEVWQYATAGLLAMTGDRIARRLMGLVDQGRLPWNGGPRQ
jgi:hypothetical protein